MKIRTKIAISIVRSKLYDHEGFIRVFIPFVFLIIIISIFLNLDFSDQIFLILALGIFITKVDHFSRALLIADDLLSMKHNGIVVVESKIKNHTIVSGLVHQNNVNISKYIVIPNRTFEVLESIKVSY